MDQFRFVTAYPHSGREVFQDPDPSPGAYYCSAVASADTVALLAGPFSTHAEALALLPTAKAAAIKAGAWAAWYAFGTLRLAPGFHTPGVLNEAIGLPVLRTSAEWTALLLVPKGVAIMDPDGWDRANWQHSWHEELITRKEFERRCMHSTMDACAVPA